MKFVSLAGLLCGVLAGGLTARAGEQVWSGTVSVTADLEVASGDTLRIEAGARIEIAAGVTIRVRGRLLAEGTEPAPILFTRRTAGTRWERILFIDSGDSRLEHCTIEFADCAGDHAQGREIEP